MSVVRVGGIVNLKLSPPVAFIERQTDEFRDRLRDLTGLWRRFSRTMAAIERERFASEGGSTWPQLAPSTVREKERLGFPPFPLIRTGELYQSLTEPSRAAAFTASEMTWGTDVPYAKYHQGYRDDGGAPTDPGRPPVRKVLDITVPDRRRLETDMVGWLNDTAREAFGTGAGL